MNKEKIILILILPSVMLGFTWVCMGPHGSRSLLRCAGIQDNDIARESKALLIMNLALSQVFSAAFLGITNPQIGKQMLLVNGLPRVYLPL